MHDHTMSRLTVVTIALWLAVTACIVAAWMVVICDASAWRWAVLLGMTGLALSAVAATASIKSYAVRTCGLIRATSGLDGGGDDSRSELRALR